MRFVEVNGTALRYDVCGSGSTLVLIHEMGGTLESWDLVVPLLSNKRRVLRYDTRGAGLSQKTRAPLSIDTMVDDLVALLDALHISKRVALAGVAQASTNSKTSFNSPAPVETASDMRSCASLIQISS